MRYSVISLALLGLVSSPAFAIQVAAQHCQGADWYAQGQLDGQQGRSISRLVQFRDACAVHGIAVDLEAYRSGRAQGLQRHCSVAAAVRAGQTNRSAGLCSAPQYQQAYRLGLDVHRLEAQLLHVSDELRATRGQRRQYAQSPLRGHQWYRYQTGINKGPYIDKYRYGSYRSGRYQHGRSSYYNSRYSQTLVPDHYDRYHANAHLYSNTRSRRQYLAEEQKRLRLRLNERRRALHELQLRLVNRSDLPKY